MLHALAEFDAGVLLFIQEFVRNRFLTPVLVFITGLGDAGMIWIAISLAFLCFRKTRRIGCMSLLALFFSLCVNNLLLKQIVARTRPYDAIHGLVPLVARLKDFSFPSGHSAAAFSAAGVFVRMLPKRFGIPLLLFAIVIALSRLYVGVHYPSDVLCGVLSGILLSYAAQFCVEKVWRQSKSGAA